jgi:hypothetical protein
MALRVARGLFRLWLVLSVLWIIGVAVVTWWTFPSDGSLDWSMILSPETPPLGGAGARGRSICDSLSSYTSSVCAGGWMGIGLGGQGLSVTARRGLTRARRGARGAVQSRVI